MERIKKVKYILMGVLITILVSQFVTPALAALAKKTIEIYTGVNIYIDDVKLNPKDSLGNPIEPFVHNGTVFLPARAIAEALGKVVQYDGKTNSAYLGKHEGTTPAVWLKDLDYFTSKGIMYTADTAKDNLGNTHTNIISGKYEYDDIDSSRTYMINGQYGKITGVLFQTYECRSSGSETTLKIYGDGQLLYTATMGPGIEPIPFDVNLEGVLELKIVHNGYFDYYWVSNPLVSAIGECGLYS